MKLINIFFYLTETDEQGNFLHSGASFNINTGDFNPKTGYFVALVGNERRYSIPKTSNGWSNIVLDYLNKSTLDKIAGREDIYLGFWLHNDQLIIDLSEHIEDRNEAIREGYARGQIAIYDAESGKDIYMTRVSSDPDLLNAKH